MKSRLFKYLEHMQILAIIAAPIAVWVLLGQFVAGLFFPGVYAEHPATVPFIFLAGFAVGRLSEWVQGKMIEVFKKKKGIK